MIGIPYPIDPQNELLLFRAVQEALNNAIKHSEATQLTVKLRYGPQELQVMVIDNGKGFVPPTPNSSEGSGMRNMRNRAKLIGASFQIDSGKDGTEIRLNVPIIAA